MVFFTCFVQGSTIKFFVRGKCPRYFPWPTFKLLCGKSKMSIILLNILTICSVMNITLKGEDEEGRLFKDIQVRTSVTFVSLWTASLYGIVSNNWRIFLLCPKLFFKMTISDNIMTVMEHIIGHVGYNTAVKNVVEFDKKFVRYQI